MSAALFYTHFESKEQCLLAAFDAELAAIEKQVIAAVRDVEECPPKTQVGLKALLGALVERHSA